MQVLLPFLHLFMANIFKKIKSQKLFWLNGKNETSGMDLGEALDYVTKKQGVACDGAVNGLYYASTVGTEPAGPLRMTLEIVGGVHYLVVRDCTGALVSAYAGITTFP
jgi:hypothetical protein